MTDPTLIGVAREVVDDLHRWYRAFSSLTAYAIDMGHAAEQLEDAVKREGDRLEEAYIDLALTRDLLRLARIRAEALEAAIADFLDHPHADHAICDLRWVLRGDSEEAVKLT